MLYDVVDQFERMFVKNNHSCLRDLFVDVSLLWHLHLSFTVEQQYDKSLKKEIRAENVALKSIEFQLTAILSTNVVSQITKRKYIDH